MWSVDVEWLWLLSAAIAVLGLLLLGGLLYYASVLSTKLRTLQQELMATENELQARSVALVEAEREMEHLTFDVPGQQIDSGWQRLEDRLGIDLTDIDELDVGEDLSISLTDGSTLRVPLDVVEELARPTCLACVEFANDYADLSVGGVGSPDGYSTAVIRTDKGARVSRGALG